MFESKSVIVVGWFAAAGLGFLAGMTGFRSPSVNQGTACAESFESVAARAHRGEAMAWHKTTSALTGSAAASPFVSAPATPTPVSPGVLPSASALPELASVVHSAARPPNAPTTIVNHYVLQEDSVLLAPETPNDHRRQYRMSIDVSAIP